MFSFCLDIYLGVELLCHMVEVCLCLIIWKTTRLFSKIAVPFYIPSPCVRVLMSPHPHQHLLLLDLLTVAIPVGVMWYLIMILISIFLMTNDVEHIFKYLLAICVSSSQEPQFRFLVHFLIGPVNFYIMHYFAADFFSWQVIRIANSLNVGKLLETDMPACLI